MADETKIEMNSKNDDNKEENDDDIIPPGQGSVCQALNEFGKGARCYFFTGLIAAILNGCVFPAFAILFQGMTDALFGTDTDLKKEAIILMIQFLALGAATFVLSIFQFGLLGVFGTHLGVEIRKKYFDVLLRQEIGYYDKQNSGKVNTMFIQNTNYISAALGSKYGFFIQNITQFFAGFAVAFYFSWQMALILCACLPAIVVVGLVQAKLVLGSDNGKSSPFTQAGTFSNEVLLNVKTVIANPKLLQFKFKHYADKLDEAFPRARRKALGVGFGLGGIMFGMFGVMYSIGLYFGSGLVDRGIITIGGMMGCFFGFIMGGMALGQLGSVFEDLGKCSVAVNELYWIIKKPIERKNNHLTSDYQNIDTSEKVKIRGDISFNNVSFCYPVAPDIKVLKSINFSIKAGTNLAICGPSGSGKSTIISLIERFYDNTEGTIKIDGKLIEDYDVVGLRNNIGYVSQLPLLFKESVKENIRGGNKNITDDDIIEAAKFAQCHDFIINNLPNGYDTLAGEMGDRLSGGQRQRISIARAIVTKPTILLFDEATSALDTQSEKEVQKAINEITSSNKFTIITIAHRLSTIKNADKILVLVDGIISEEGTHNELMQNDNGVYHGLVTSQQIIEENESQ